MQEEIENRTVTLIISAVKLTARELKAGMDKYLSEKKSKAMEKARAAPEKPTGKQTVKQLIGVRIRVYPTLRSPTAISKALSAWPGNTAWILPLRKTAGETAEILCVL